MLPLNSKPKGGEYVKLVFRAFKYMGCDEYAFRDAVNRKVKESKFFALVNPAVAVRETDTAVTDNTRDEMFTECLVIMQLPTQSTPTYDGILSPLRNFIGGAWSCVGTSGGIRLLDANLHRYETPASIRSSSQAAADSTENRPKMPEDEALGAVKAVAYAIIAGAFVYMFVQAKGIFKAVRG